MFNLLFLCFIHARLKRFNKYSFVLPTWMIFTYIYVYIYIYNFFYVYLTCSGLIILLNILIYLLLNQLMAKRCYELYHMYSSDTTQSLRQYHVTVTAMSQKHVFYRESDV